MAEEGTKEALVLEDENRKQYAVPVDRLGEFEIGKDDDPREDSLMVEESEDGKRWAIPAEVIKEGEIADDQRFESEGERDESVGGHAYQKEGVVSMRKSYAPVRTLQYEPRQVGRPMYAPAPQPAKPAFNPANFDWSWARPR